MTAASPAGDRPGWLTRRTLRFRVLASLMLLVVGACAVVGIVTLLALRSFLIGQLDRQLQSAGGRYTAAAQDPDDVSGFGDARGQALGTLGARIEAGHLTTIGIVGRPRPPAAGAAALQAFALVPLGRPVSRDLPGLGDYRLLAARAPDGARVVTGLPLHPVNDTLGTLLLVELVVFGVVIAAAAAGGLGLVRLSLRPLDRVTATARRVTESSLTDSDSELTPRVPTPVTGTEVGQLGIAFNRMLDHVADGLAARRATERRLRQFIADASHELRTPVASIRAHAESVRHSDDDVPPSVELAMRRIEGEAIRMGVLVDDLLLLARLDAGRPLDSRPVDLSRLVIDAANDARVSFPGHRWCLNLPEDQVVVSGDEFRLHQVLANLLSNAGSHTEPGAVVSVDLVAAGRTTVLTVRDDGPGIPAENQPHVFERFFRADTSSTAADGSNGLGLAIVAAVVHAHRGEVSVTSRPGDTRFTVVLPHHSDEDALAGSGPRGERPDEPDR